MSSYEMNFHYANWTKMTRTNAFVSETWTLVRVLFLFVDSNDVKWKKNQCDDKCEKCLINAVLSVHWVKVQYSNTSFIDKHIHILNRTLFHAHKSNCTRNSLYPWKYYGIWICRGYGQLNILDYDYLRWCLWFFLGIVIAKQSFDS